MKQGVQVCGSLSLAIALVSGGAWAEELETIHVEGRQINLLGEAVSASEGVVGEEEIRVRPILRTGEVMELVPGMVVTQHSGTGKANQYFLRGFNLDHGSDFATSVDGMPVNMRTHGHGQGYSDLNFLIPETVSKIHYRKGAYFADVGDFSGAGSAQISTVNYAQAPMIEASIGEDDWSRLLLTGGVAHENGNTLAALEVNHYDGPWSDISENVRKKNLLLKHTRDLGDGEFSLTFMGYDNSWNSADQIPERAVTSGAIDELGSLDDSLGGESSRYSVSANWQNKHWQVSGYVIDSDLDLWSNFTYYLDDEDNGDQFQQVDDRMIYGGQIRYQHESQLTGMPMSNSVGVDVRVDDIDEVGLWHTQDRQRLGVIRSDSVMETGAGLYWENRLRWSDSLRSVVGARFDYLGYDVSGNVGVNTNGVSLAANDGDGSDHLGSLKASLIYTLSDNWETYASAGQGMHSNDVRGATIEVDPADGSQVDTVDPLVRSFGYEAGLRGFIADQLNMSVSLWSLDLDSELVFVGDAGNTEASGKSRRQGVELTAYWRLNEWLDADFEYANTDAKLTGHPEEGDHIPGAVEDVVQAGLTARLSGGAFASIRARYLGERPLTEDASVMSDSSLVWNLRAGYRWSHWRAQVDVLNVLDSDDHDIDYYYESRLATDPSGAAISDVHYHVMEPRTVRLSVAYQFD